MIVTLLGTRGSLGRAGGSTLRYGGDTSSVKVEDGSGSVMMLDAGSGISRLEIPAGTRRIDVMLTHLHMDHIQGLGFFRPLFDPTIATHIWGPVSTTKSLAQRLTRYLSPPLFPVLLRDLPNTHVHDVHPGTFAVGGYAVTADLVCHPGPTLAFRVEEEGSSFAYMPDHEVALGVEDFPHEPEWTSGFGIAEGVDVLIHDTQYTDEEYELRVGWGHSTLRHAVAFSDLAQVGKLITFHHDTEHSDEWLDRRVEKAIASLNPDFELISGTVDLEIEV